jgi:hypothetical protein
VYADDSKGQHREDETFDCTRDGSMMRIEKQKFVPETEIHELKIVLDPDGVNDVVILYAANLVVQSWHQWVVLVNIIIKKLTVRIFVSLVKF